VIPTAMALAVLSVVSIPATAITSAGHPATKAGLSHIRPADYSHRRHYSHARPSRFPHQVRVPRHLRGFEDPGYAYHGSINGCVIDQGYGRWASCSTGR
jgi:hypothetical protein